MALPSLLWIAHLQSTGRHFLARSSRCDAVQKQSQQRPQLHGVKGLLQAW